MPTAFGDSPISPAGMLDQFLQQNGIKKKGFEDFIYKTIILSFTDAILSQLKTEDLKTTLREQIRKLPVGCEGLLYERIIEERLNIKLNNIDMNIIKQYLNCYLKSGTFREKKPTKEKQKSKLAEQNNRCAFCGLEIQSGNYHIDHIFPHYFFGDEMISDFQLLCPSCNERKSSKILSTLNLVSVPECPVGQLLRL
ncbi:HNH endonuclease [bacterium]|nr:HNH endonuclease [bacterium]